MSTEHEHSPVSLSLEAKPENAAVARRAVAEEAARTGLADRLSAAAKVIVTEGFNNAVRHAYRAGGSERVVIRASGDREGMTITVRDFGGGFRPSVPEPDRPGGFGLGLIAALADRVELCRHREGGTSVRARIDDTGPR